MKPDPTDAFAAPAAPSLGPVVEFLRTVWALDHALQSTSRRMESTLGVTAPQRLVLRILGRFPGMKAGQLAAILHLHPSTVTGVLKRLQRRGLITRQADPRDRRRAVLGLTVKGRALAVITQGTVEEAIRTAFDELPPEKLRSAVEVLSRLTRLLDDHVEPIEQVLAKGSDAMDL